MDWLPSLYVRRLNAAIAALLCVAIVAPVSAQMTAEHANRGLVEILAGSADSSSIKIVEDLSLVLDDGGARRILPVVGKGSLQNVADLKLLRGVDVALIQSDVLEFIRREGLYPGAITYAAKLYDEELHLLARDDVRDVSDLARKRVNFGLPGDGTSITGPAIFDKLRIKVEATSYAPSLALEKLLDGDIAALAYVVGKPAGLFRALRRQNGLHLVPIPFNPDVFGSYVPARFTREDYPDLVIDEPVDTVAVGTAMMVANLIPGSERYRNVAAFVEAFFTQFPRLQEAGHHPKWREVNLSADLPRWNRFAPAENWLKRNVVASAPSLNEQELRAVFSKFLDERSRSADGRTMSTQEKDRLFELFRSWQSRQPSQ